MDEDAKKQSLTRKLDDKDVFKILVATDNHIGHKEKDMIRSDDSFSTFEEILIIAKALKVDLLLHGGDLFDVQKPSNDTMYKVLRLLRKYCLGRKTVEYETLYPTEPALKQSIAPLKYKPNYKDPNVQVSLPVFMIHGNHDDPSGDGNLSALDILEVSHLINYFGKADNLEDISIAPILLQKNATKIALYGLGNIRDERLHRAFIGGKVKFILPGEEGVPAVDDVFNIMAIHQNRYKGVGGGILSKNCIHESMLPNFLDLIIWGHEHDCLIDPKESLKGEFHIIQPGSSVQTSLGASEALEKHVALLEISGDTFRSTAIPLITPRAFVRAELFLNECGLLSKNETEIWSLLNEKVNELLKEALNLTLRRRTEYRKNFPYMYQMLQGVLPRESPLPLIRVKVENTGFGTVSSARFGQAYVGKLANPQDILQFFRKASRVGKSTTNNALPELQVEAIGSSNDGAGVHDIIFHFVKENQSSLDLLLEQDLNMSVQDYVMKMNAGAVSLSVNKQIQETIRDLKNKITVGEETSKEKITNMIKQRTSTKRESSLDIHCGEDTTRKRKLGDVDCGMNDSEDGIIGSSQQQTNNTNKTDTEENTVKVKATRGKTKQELRQNVKPEPVHDFMNSHQQIDTENTNNESMGYLGNTMDFEDDIYSGQISQNTYTKTNYENNEEHKLFPDTLDNSNNNRNNISTNININHNNKNNIQKTASHDPKTIKPYTQEGTNNQRKQTNIQAYFPTPSMQNRNFYMSQSIQKGSPKESQNSDAPTQTCLNHLSKKAPKSKISLKDKMLALSQSSDTMNVTPARTFTRKPMKTPGEVSTAVRESGASMMSDFDLPESGGSIFGSTQNRNSYDKSHLDRHSRDNSYHSSINNSINNGVNNSINSMDNSINKNINNSINSINNRGNSTNNDDNGFNLQDNFASDIDNTYKSNVTLSAWQTKTARQNKINASLLDDSDIDAAFTDEQSYTSSWG